MGENILEVKNLCKSFGITKANDNVSFDLRAGELHCLAGENGSGKSTLINSLVGIHKPDSGEMILNGSIYSPSSPIDARKAGIGFVVQELGLIGDFDACMNMFLGDFERFTSKGVISTGRMEQAAKDELAKWRFKPVPLHTKAVNMSIEQRKIVEITKALSSNPSILILDETTQSLSQDTKERLYEIIDSELKKGTAIIMITHDLEEMCRMADRVTVLRDGQSVRTLEKDEINEDVVRNLMVGRTINADYYRTDNSCIYEDEVVLRVDHISDGSRYRDVSFELHKGEILGFCGLSDAGIHDIGKAIFALKPPKSGRVSMGKSGNIIKKPLDATKNKIAYVPKDRDSEALLMDASISANICVPSVKELEQKAFFISPASCRRLAEKAREKLSIKCTSVNQIVSSLSGGNKQKVNIGRWLVKDLEILVLDCPTRGVDVGVKAYIYNLMKEMKKKGMSIILISDEITEILGMADRVIVMKDGKVAGTLRRDEILTESKVIGVMM